MSMIISSMYTKLFCKRRLLIWMTHENLENCFCYFHYLLKILEELLFSAYTCSLVGYNICNIYNYSVFLETRDKLPNRNELGQRTNWIVVIF